MEINWKELGWKCLIAALAGGLPVLAVTTNWTWAAISAILLAMIRGAANIIIEYQMPANAKLTMIRKGKEVEYNQIKEHWTTKWKRIL